MSDKRTINITQAEDPNREFIEGFLGGLLLIVVILVSILALPFVFIYSVACYAVSKARTL